MPTLQGLIFDLDGTLLDSAADLRQAINATLIHHKRRVLTLNEVKEMTGDGMMALIVKAFDKTGLPILRDALDATFQQFISFYSELKPSRDQLYPHVIDTLETYSERKVKLALCTNKLEASTLQLLDGLKITSLFDFVAGGDTFPVHKPHPGHVEGVLDAINLEATSSVMIGDSLNDISAAKGAHVLRIAVTHGYGGQNNNLGADSTITSFLELENALEKFGFTEYPRANASLHRHKPMKKDV